MKSALLILALVSVCGCNTAHSPYIVRNTTSASFQSDTRYASHGNSVFVTKETIPPGLSYEVLERVEVGKIWYGSRKDVIESLANRARQIGADAVFVAPTLRLVLGCTSRFRKSDQAF